ncbi:MAG: hypothetical protein R3D82_18785 [Xanthobacteraceae bacterium]|nr:hypothetical protein [Bradyrhizobium sp.]
MSSASTPKSAEPDAGRGAPAEERLERAHELVRGADEQLARLSAQVEKMERDAARESSAARPPSVGSGGQSAPVKPTFRGRIGLPLAACIIAGALILQWSQGWGAKLAGALWSPQPASTPSVEESAVLPVQPASPDVQAAAAEPAPPQAMSVAQAAPQDAVPATTAAIPDQSQAELLRKMADDLANVERSIEQLKAAQQQLASDSAKDIAELKASQEEIKRALAKLSEQNTSKASAPPPAPTATLRKPGRKVKPPRARARPRIPREEWYYDDW